MRLSYNREHGSGAKAELTSWRGLHNLEWCGLSSIPVATVYRRWRLQGVKVARPHLAEHQCQHIMARTCHACNVEVLGTQGTNPLAQWKVLGSAKLLQKVYDKAIKGSVFASGNSSGIKIQTPKDDKSSLGLVQPFLVLQACLQQGSPLTVEVGLQDATNTRRRLILSSSFTDAKITPLHCQIPFAAVARDTWLNLVIPLIELVPLMFRGASFKCLDTMLISGTCRLRRVFTLRDAPYDTLQQYDQYSAAQPLPLPRGLELPAGLDVFTQVLDAKLLNSLGVHLPSQVSNQVAMSPKLASRGHDGSGRQGTAHQQQQQQGVVAARQTGWSRAGRDSRQASSPSPTFGPPSHLSSRDGRDTQTTSSGAVSPDGGPPEHVQLPVQGDNKPEPEADAPATWATIVSSKVKEERMAAAGSRQKGSSPPGKPGGATWDATATDGGIKSVGATGRHGRARTRLTDETVTVGADDAAQAQLGSLLPPPSMYGGSTPGRPTTDSCTITSKWARSPMAGRRAVSAQVPARSHSFDVRELPAALQPSPTSPVPPDRVPGTPVGGQRRGSPVSRGQSPSRRGGGSPHPPTNLSAGTPSRLALQPSGNGWLNAAGKGDQEDAVGEAGSDSRQPSVGLVLSDLPTTPASPNSRFGRRHGSQAHYGVNIPYTIKEGEAVNSTPRCSSGAASVQEAASTPPAQGQAKQRLTQALSIGDALGSPLRPQTQQQQTRAQTAATSTAPGTASRGASRGGSGQRTTSPGRGGHPSPGSKPGAAGPRGSTPPTNLATTGAARGSVSQIAAADSITPLSPSASQARGPPSKRDASHVQSSSSTAAPDLEGVLHVRGGLDASIDITGMSRLSLGPPGSFTASVFARANSSCTSGLPAPGGVLTQDPPTPPQAVAAQHEGSFQGRASLRPKPIDLAVCRDPSLACGPRDSQALACGPRDSQGVTFPVLGAASPLMNSNIMAQRDRYLRQSSSSSTTSGTSNTAGGAQQSGAGAAQQPGAGHNSGSPTTAPLRGPTSSPSTQHIPADPACTLLDTKDHPTSTTTTTTTTTTSNTISNTTSNTPQPSSPGPTPAMLSTRSVRHPSPQARAATGVRSASPPAAGPPMSPARALSPGATGKPGVKGSMLPSKLSGPGSTPSRASHVPVSPASKTTPNTCGKPVGGAGEMVEPPELVGATAGRLPGGTSSKTSSPARGGRGVGSQAAVGSAPRGGSPSAHTRKTAPDSGMSRAENDIKSKVKPQQRDREPSRSILSSPKAGPGGLGLSKPRGRGAGGDGRAVELVRGSMASSACEVDESVHLEGTAWGVDEEDVLASRHFEPSGGMIVQAAPQPLQPTQPPGLSTGTGFQRGRADAATANPAAPGATLATPGAGLQAKPGGGADGGQSLAGDPELMLEGVGAPTWSSTAPSMRPNPAAQLEALLDDLVLQGDVTLSAQGTSGALEGAAGDVAVGSDASRVAARPTGDVSNGFSFHQPPPASAQVPVRHAGYGDGDSRRAGYAQGSQGYMGPAVGGPLRRYTVHDDTLLASTGSLQGAAYHKGMDVDWAHVEHLMAAPVDLAAAARAFTPPVIPPSQQMAAAAAAAGKQLAGRALKSSSSGPQVLALHSDAVAGAGGGVDAAGAQKRPSLHDRSSAGSLKSRLSQAATGAGKLTAHTSLKAAQSGTAVVAGTAGSNGLPGVLKHHQAQDEMVDLLYDPLLNCYYDQKTGNYFALKQ